MPDSSIQQDKELTTQIIRSCLMSTHIYSKVSFDNAKDATELNVAASEAEKALIQIVEFRMRDRLDELLIDRISRHVDDRGPITVMIGGRAYKLEELSS
jgi:hypothetical protein